MNLHDKVDNQTDKTKKMLSKWERATVKRMRKAERMAAQHAKVQGVIAKGAQRLNQQESEDQPTDGCTLWVVV